MIIFWTNFGGGGQGQGGWESLLPVVFLFLIPLFAQLFGGGGGLSTSYVYDSRLGWHRVVERETRVIAEGPPATIYSQIATLVAFVMSLAVGFLAMRQAARRQQQAAGGGGGGGRNLHRTHSERVALTSSLVQKLPIEIHQHSREELERKSIPELKALLSASKKENLNLHGRGDGVIERETLFLEKKELVDAILVQGETATQASNSNSSAETCSICVEDYSAGDVKRVLPRCGHRFHIECIDRWFLGHSTDYSRPAACPMCNTQLEEE